MGKFFENGVHIMKKKREVNVFNWNFSNFFQNYEKNGLCSKISSPQKFKFEIRDKRRGDSRSSVENFLSHSAKNFRKETP